MSPQNMRNVAMLVDKNFGSIYNTSGGGKKQYGGINVTQFLKDLLGNRVLDVYLKYLGVKTLTTATLVPFGLIYGKDFVEKQLSAQTGGDFLSVIPFIDHPLIGSYLKIAGLAAAKLKASTLVPLGVLMVVYQLYHSKQVGGKIVFTKNAKNKIGSQSGGARTIFGASIPPNIVQTVDHAIRGQPMYSPPANHNLACQNGNCGVNLHSSHFKPVATNMNLPGFPEYNISPSNVSLNWSGNLDTITFPDVPQTMAGGSLKNKKSRGLKKSPRGVSRNQSAGSVTKSELSEYYNQNMNNRNKVVNRLINEWQKYDKNSIPTELSRSIKKMSNDKRYSNRTIANLFPKNVLLNGLN